MSDVLVPASAVTGAAGRLVALCPSLAAAAAAAAATTLVAGAVVRRAGPATTARWARTNHRGEPVTLLEGPVVTAGAVLALALPLSPSHVRAAAALAVAGAGALGALDDLAGDGGSKGLSGHLGALRHGQVTTGAAKVVGLAVLGVAASALCDRPRRGALDVLAGGAVVAGCANLVNLLDLRPGRALKVVLLCAPAAAAGAGAAGAGAAAVAAGAAVAALGDDLAERSMLGDTGANALGALLGVALVAGSGTTRRWALLAGLTALTLASERISFTAVIEATPVLRRLDQLGRRAAPLR